MQPLHLLRCKSLALPFRILLMYFPVNVAKLTVGWRLYLSCSRLEKAERHLIINPQTQRAPSKFCSRLFDQHVAVWGRTDNLPVSQPAHQPLAVSQSVSLPLQCSKLPKTGGKQRVRQKKSNLTFLLLYSKLTSGLRWHQRPPSPFDFFQNGCGQRWIFNFVSATQGRSGCKVTLSLSVEGWDLRSSRPLMDTDRQCSRSSLVCWLSQSLI